MTDESGSDGSPSLETTVDGETEQIVGEAVATHHPPAAHASRDALDTREDAIRDAVLRMGTLVVAAIRQAGESLKAHDATLAHEVIVGDGAINAAQRSVSRLIVEAIATQQPVARDLRYLLTLDHVTYELERIGDHASSVAKQVKKLAPEPPLEGYVHLPEMAERAAVLVHGVLQALVDADAARAREVAVEDDRIDHLYHETFDRAVEIMRRDPENVERGTRIVITSHYLERIGDRATNIAEDIVYLVTGDVEDLNP